jgi:pimeloyl-ACP methyl ester carboxylesterase
MAILVRTIVIALALFSATAASAAPGDLISADPIVETPGGTQAWRIRYETRGERGAPIQVTGMVVAPREAIPPRPRRVIAWTHGTWGVAERCAPSLSPSFFTATPGLGEAVRAGYVVVAPDYPGLGSPGPHPLLVGAPTARSVLDAVRASSAIPDAAAGKDFAVWGESQGGHAALWTARLAPSYVPDLRLVGAVAAAPPTDLARNMALGADRNARAMLTSMTAWSWSKLYGAPMTTFGRPPLQNVMLRLAQNNCIELDGKPKLGTVLGVVTVANALRRVDLTQAPVWSRIMRENSVAPLSGPLMIVQGGKDQVVAPEVTRAYARQACRAGARLRYLDLPQEDHVSATRASVRQALDWIGKRFAGERPPSDCRRI